MHFKIKCHKLETGKKYNHQAHRVKLKRIQLSGATVKTLIKVKNQEVA